MKRIIAVAALLGLLGLACGSSANTGTVITPGGGSPATEAATSASPAKYNVGDLVQLTDQTIVLNSLTLKNATLVANFTVTNTGTADVNVSSAISFDAKDSDGSKMEWSIIDCGGTLDGKILAGDKLKGDVCWKATGKPPYHIQYQASLLASGAIVWEVSP